MATYPLGKERKTIGINMKQEMADELETRAVTNYEQNKYSGSLGATTRTHYCNRQN